MLTLSLIANLMVQGKRLVFFEFRIRADWNGNMVDDDGNNLGEGEHARAKAAGRRNGLVLHARVMHV